MTILTINTYLWLRMDYLFALMNKKSAFPIFFKLYQMTIPKTVLFYM